MPTYQTEPINNPIKTIDFLFCFHKITCKVICLEKRQRLLLCNLSLFSFCKFSLLPRRKVAKQSLNCLKKSAVDLICSVAKQEILDNGFRYVRRKSAKFAGIVLTNRVEQELQY